MFVVFDLDGTLALIEHRRHLVNGEKQNWDAFFEACIDDLPNVPIIETFKAIVAAGHRVEIWSGRSADVTKPTVDWLSKHIDLPEDAEDIEVRMRPSRDYTPDNDLKLGWTKAYGVPDLVFDDRDKVVKMWRENGITCAQVAPGNF